MNLSPLERKGLKQLKENKDIVVLPADKGRRTVVMDASDEKSKMLTLLGDEALYQYLKHDPTPLLERKMNKELSSLNWTGMLPDTDYEKLWISVGVTPRIYGLPKVHKPQVPLRPIVSFVTSPTYQLSK